MRAGEPPKGAGSYARLGRLDVLPVAVRAPDKRAAGLGHRGTHQFEHTDGNKHSPGRRCIEEHPASQQR